MEQPTSDSQIISITDSGHQGKDFVHILKQLHKLDYDRILLRRETDRFLSDWGHCNDRSFETFFTHP